MQCFFFCIWFLSLYATSLRLSHASSISISLLLLMMSTIPLYEQSVRDHSIHHLLVDSGLFPLLSVLSDQLLTQLPCA